jgi:glycosyltransferase involved in cell wall biosynthesis
MACGKPVVVSRAGGAAELFTDGHDAVGVRPADAEALAAAVAALAADPGRARCIAREARRTAVAKFSYHRLGRQMVGAYERFLTGG